MVPKHLQEILFSKTIKFKFMFVYGTLHFAKDFFELLFEFNFMISCAYDATSRKMLLSLNHKSYFLLLSLAQKRPDTAFVRI